MPNQCSKCGTAVPGGGTFCPSCGTPIATPAPEAVEAAPNPVDLQPQTTPAPAVDTPDPALPTSDAAAVAPSAPETVAPPPESAAAPPQQQEATRPQSLWAPPPGTFKLHPPKVEMPKAIDLPKLGRFGGAAQAGQPSAQTSQPRAQTAAGQEAPTGSQTSTTSGISAPAATPPTPTLGSAPAISAASPKSLRNAGIGALVVMLLAGLFFFRGGDDPAPASPPPETGQGPQDPPPVEPVDNGGAEPPVGGLESLVVPRVGVSTFNGALANPDLIQLTGALDAISVEYLYNDGTPLRGAIARFASAEGGAAGVQAIANIVTINEGHQTANQFDITGADNLPLGGAIQLIGVDEVFIWNYADIVYTIRGPAGYAVDYFNNFLAGT